MLKKYTILFLVMISLLLISCSSNNMRTSKSSVAMLKSIEKNKSIDFDTPPKLLKIFYPKLPANQEENKDKVLLQIELLANRSVGEIIVLNSPDDTMTSSAIDAARQYEFEPAKYRGENVTLWVKMTVPFRTSKFVLFDEPPVPIKTVSPKYPISAKSAGISGIVTLDLEILDTGDVREVEVVKSSNEIFNQPAIDAVKKFKFSPAKRNGEAVSVWLKLPIQFK